MRWTEAYIGVPFVPLGRDLAGWDCWGLVRHIVRQRAGIVLEPYTIAPGDLRRVAAAMDPAAIAADWSTIPQGEERELDVVVMRSIHDSGHAAEMHVGLVVAPGRLLHVEQGVDTVCLPFGHHSLAGRIRRIHRHRLLA